jgi:uncharacterized membrane protein YwzB
VTDLTVIVVAILVTIISGVQISNFYLYLDSVKKADSIFYPVRKLNNCVLGMNGI